MKERPAAVNWKIFFFFAARSISLAASLAPWIVTVWLENFPAFRSLCITLAFWLWMCALRIAAGWFLIVKELRT
jgi:hypothetical protein